jgi:hypothetical protein
MAKPPKKPKDEDIEVAPDAWERFEKTIDKIGAPKRKPIVNTRKSGKPKK